MQRLFRVIWLFAFVVGMACVLLYPGRFSGPEPSIIRPGRLSSNWPIKPYDKSADKNLSGGHQGWSYSCGKFNNAIRCVFRSKNGDGIDVLFNPRDPKQPCFAATEKFNISYVGRTLSPDAEQFLKSIARDIRDRESDKNASASSRSDEPLASLFISSEPKYDKSLLGLLRAEGRKVFSSARAYCAKLPISLAPYSMLVILVAFLLLMLLLFDIVDSILKRAEDEQGRESAEPAQRKDLLVGVFFGVALAAVLASKLLFVFCKTVSSDDMYFFLMTTHSKVFLFNIIHDEGMPSMTYRLLLPLLTRATETWQIRMFLLVLAGITAGVVKRLVRGHARASVAWLAAIAYAASTTVNDSVSDMRGIMLFVLLTMLGLLFLDSAARRPSRLALFFWVAAQTGAVASNPIVIPATAGMVVFYFLSLRKQLSASWRTLFDIHAIALACASALLIPFAFRAVTLHSGDQQSFAASDASFRAFVACMVGLSVMFLAAAYAFRRDRSGAIYLFSACGIIAICAALYLSVLSPKLNYFIFIVPASIAGVAILADKLITRLEPRVPAHAGRIAAVIALGVILLGAFMPLVWNNPIARYKESVAMSAGIDRFLSGVRPRNPNVFIASMGTFFDFIIFKYDISPFDWDQRRNEFFKVRPIHPKGSTPIPFLNNIYASPTIPERTAIMSVPAPRYVFVRSEIQLRGQAAWIESECLELKSPVKMRLFRCDD